MSQAAQNMQTKPIEHNFDPIIYHYVNKTGIERSQTLGLPSTALCGERRTFVNPIAGRAVDAAQGRTICPLCQLVFSGLQDKRTALNG